MTTDACTALLGLGYSVRVLACLLGSKATESRTGGEVCPRKRPSFLRSFDPLRADTPRGSADSKPAAKRGLL
jgi:hypothetical protein